jgi:phenylalanyl-tRNA synthetase beta chain
MIISYNRIQSYIQEPLPAPHELAACITAKLFEIEEVTTVGSDTMFDIKVLADRASYCYGHRFVAREIAVITGLTYVPIMFQDVSSSASTELPAPEIRIDAPIRAQACMLYHGRRITGIHNGPSPLWLTDFLTTVGQRSINYIVDLTNFVMLNTGQPMHAFDAAKVNGAIEVRYARSGESIELLDGRVITFDEIPTLVIADQVGPLALAGVKGGKRAEVTSDTTDIILESAHFEKVYVRKTAERYAIKNDSTKRFENNVSIERVPLAMAEYCSLLSSEQPDVHMSEVTVIEESAQVAVLLAPRRLSFSCTSIRERITRDEQHMHALSSAYMCDILNRLDLHTTVDATDCDLIHIDIPVYRHDMQYLEDIVDEIGRIYGYDQLHGHARPHASEVAILPSSYYVREIKSALAQIGFSEVYTYTLVPQGDYALANPLTIERSHLRNTISDMFPTVFQKNLPHLDFLGIDTIKIFEIGNVFEGKREKLSLAIGVMTKEGKYKLRIIDSFQQMAIDMLAQIFAIDPARFPKSIRAEGVIEIDLEALIHAAGIPHGGVYKKGDTPSTGEQSARHALAVQEHIMYKKFSPYPYIIRDIAVFIPGPSGRAHELRSIIESLNHPLIVSIRQFDEFEKKDPDTGLVQKTSYAFRMVFQSFEKTLTDVEVEEVMTDINARIAQHPDWEIR